MNRTIVKKICIFLAGLVLLLSLGACGRVGKCEECGQNESLKAYTRRNGNVVYLCDDCYRTAKLIGY